MLPVRGGTSAPPKKRSIQVRTEIKQKFSVNGTANEDPQPNKAKKKARDRAFFPS